MSFNKEKQIAKNVQTISEQWHCASAVHAIEVIITDKLKKEYNDKIGILLDKLRDEKNIFERTKLDIELQQLNVELGEKIKSTKVSIKYADFIKDSNNCLDSARGVRSRSKEGPFTIVLPESLQRVINDNVRLGNPDWSKLKEIKKALRRKTYHELGHIIIDGNPNEDEVEAFANHLIKLREERSRVIDASD